MVSAGKLKAVAKSDRAHRAIIKGAIVSHRLHAAAKASFSYEGFIYLFVAVCAISLHIVELIPDDKGVTE